MNKLSATEGKYLTQTAPTAIEERIFVKEVTGFGNLQELYREATDEEVEQWEEYQKRMEEESQFTPNP